MLSRRLSPRRALVPTLPTRPASLQAAAIPLAALAVPALAVAMAIVALAVPLAAARAEPLTLSEAISRALAGTNRAAIIRGNQEVAAQRYEAKRINFYLPLVSINGALPTYTAEQSYRFFGASPEKSLYKTTGLGLRSYIRLEQNLITGGNLSMTADLTASKERYPDTRVTGVNTNFLDERSRQGVFQFRYEQPLLKPSTPKNELADARDDLEKARLGRRQDEAALAREVTDVYLLVLQSKVKRELATDNLESARLQAGVDSSKWRDGVISEEDWLASASARLDAELNQRQAETDAAAQERKLGLLLDRGESGDPGMAAVSGAASAAGDGGAAVGTGAVDGTVTGDRAGAGVAGESGATGEFEVVEPEPAPFGPAERERALASWEKSLPALQAERDYLRARRSAKFAAGGYGLTGDLSLTYSAGRGKIWPEDRPVDTIHTNGWNVAFNVTYPLWDGGAGAASVKSAKIQSEQARLSLEKARQDARAEIDRLVEDISVRHRRLEILHKKVELAEQRLAISEERYADGRISRIELLTSKTALLDARVLYLDELRGCLLSEADLDGMGL